MNNIYLHVISNIAKNFTDIDLNGKSILITGATGLIGKTIIYSLLKLNQNITIYAYGRDLNKLNELFPSKVINVIYLPYNYMSLDYIIHCACPTQSNILANESVEVIDVIYTMTKKCLDLAKKYSAKMIFLSSMEVYGKTNGTVTENDLGYLDLANPRSGYGEAKRLAELMCNAYKKEYNVEVSNIRLAQIYGPGAPINDKRFFSYVTNTIINNKNIILNTDGENLQNNCYITDAVTLIIKIMLSDVSSTFNIANSNTCKSINDLCKSIINIINPKLKIEYNLNTANNFRDKSFYIMNTKKINSLFPDYKFTSFDDSITEYVNYLKNELLN